MKKISQKEIERRQKQADKARKEKDMKKGLDHWIKHEKPVL
jgi:hypothetical protein